MKLQFKVQQYQTEAVDAVVDVFTGQPYADGVKYRIDPGKDAALTLLDDAGLRNTEIALTPSQLLANVQAVQRERGLPLSKELKDPVKKSAAPINLDVEMETGTGKTYVYIKTIMELHKRYGWSKYIVVVPSIAIREGVKKSFDITAEHFQQLYGTKPRTFIYNSSRLHELERFSSDAGVQVMIINIQAFNATGKDARRIYEVLDDFQSRRPIDVIAANRPILIIDEPQKIEGDAKKPSKSLEALGLFNALFALRYSATHKIERTKVHRLDAVDAYNHKLVKKIAVRGITIKHLAGSTAYLYVDGLEIGKGADFPKARVELEVQTAQGIRRQVKRLSQGMNLHDISGGIEAYKGLFIRDVDANRDIIELSNGEVISAGEVTQDVTDEAKRRIQIREVIRAHLDKERELFPQSIKVLSLFFIDEVAKYRDYEREDTLGDYARVFEEEYAAVLADYLSQLDLDEGATRYREYVEAIDVRRTHEGYFSIDRRTKQFVDGKIAARGDFAGQSDDVDAYDLILKDKERLLSFEEPVRFIWSHSALREGWDNPNVFVMGMLKKSDNTTTRRQEIGRGLRLAVDQNGERMDNPVTVHEVNELTVVTDESYTEFVTALQKEIVESLSARPRKATAEFFAGRTVEHPVTGEKVAISLDQARQLQHWLTVNGFIDYEQHLTAKWDARAEIEMPPMPAGLEEFHYQVAELIDSLRLDVPQPIDGRKPKKIPFNEANFRKREFQELWGRINHKAIYQVEFDSKELIANCIRVLDTSLNVTVMQYLVESGKQVVGLEVEQLQAGTGFKVAETKIEHSAVSASSTVKYDLLGEIAEKTQLTRRTCAAILTGITPGTFAKFKQNPEQFITEAARLINEQKATVIVEHLSYDPLDGRYDSSIFTENQTAQDLTKAGDRLKKSVYEYVVTDSKVERSFVEKLDVSDEVVVYSKLPRGFFIPTPVGDYNPDWAIAFRDDITQIKHVYFVAETKGSMSSLQLKGVEQAKIECARKFFASLNDKAEHEGVKYDVVDTYENLLALVGE
ncbi:restriction endonuclease subunit R [Pseudoclavibacter chungangensis]|uniref:Restriction endonuclease subunit R n=1 Tax=Pseudoclavibacter chungangensis TaxID=587635 RepID=A0A7J5BLZ3_9MICO|nr:DEAD/DEAH box helicase family protein [Pseudoclavibacter chungangensis]KAB1652037.1 restriction endonuclease subunit R [Pseudoclavibacter chungangensis]NYJ67565.1 type III restriction enzyme [Pseudoclavibacter chungangensis]